MKRFRMSIDLALVTSLVGITGRVSILGGPQALGAWPVPLRYGHPSASAHRLAARAARSRRNPRVSWRALGHGFLSIRSRDTASGSPSPGAHGMDRRAEIAE